MLDSLRFCFFSPPPASLSSRFLRLPSSSASSLSSLRLLLFFLLLLLLFSSSLLSIQAAASDAQEILSAIHQGREAASSSLSSPGSSLLQDEEGERETIEKKKKKEVEEENSSDREKKGGEEDEEEEKTLGGREVVEIPLWMVPKQQEKEEEEENKKDIHAKRDEEEEEEESGKALKRRFLSASSSLKNLFLFPDEQLPPSPLSRDFLHTKKTNSSSSSSFFSSAFQLQLSPSSPFSSSFSSLEMFLSRLLEDAPRLLPNIQLYNLPLHVDFCTFFSLPSVYLESSTRYGFKESHLGQAPVDDLRVYIHGEKQICEAAYQAFLQYKRNNKKKKKERKDADENRKTPGEKKERVSPSMREVEEEEEEKKNKKEEEFRVFSSWAGELCSSFLSSFYEAKHPTTRRGRTTSLHSPSSSLSLDRDPRDPSSSRSCSLPASSSPLLSGLVSLFLPSSLLSASPLHTHGEEEEEKKKKKKQDGVDETHEEGLSDARCMWRRRSGYLSSALSSSLAFFSSDRFLRLLKTFQNSLLDKILPHTYRTNSERLLSHAGGRPEAVLLPFPVRRKKEISLSLERSEEVKETEKKKMKTRERQKERREKEEENRRKEVEKFESLDGRDRDRQGVDIERSNEVSSVSLLGEKEREEENKEEEEDLFSSSSSLSTEREEIYLVEVCSDRRGRSFDEVYIHLPFMFNLVFLVYPYGLAPVAYTVVYSVLLASILTFLSLLYIFPHYRLKLR